MSDPMSTSGSNGRVVYPPDAAAIIDVTKAPYFADPTGQTDCTRILVQILDDLLTPSREGMRIIMEMLEAEPAENLVLPNSFENRKQAGRKFGVFPLEKPLAKIVYFPEGTYLVSDTICYSFDDLRNGLDAELNWCIRFQGESQSGSVIKLQDRCRGFEYGMKRPVVSFIRGASSNIAMSNYFRDLTIDVGTGNAGAVGLEFMSNNSGGVRNVTVRTSDPAHRGQFGISVSRDRTTGCFFQSVTVDGFDDGISITGSSSYLVLEDIELRNQRNHGVYVSADSILSLRNIHSRNLRPAVHLASIGAHLVLVDAELHGGLDDAPAVELTKGQLFLRNVKSSGYRYGLGMKYTDGWGSDPIISDSYISEYVSGPVCCLNDGEQPRSLNLPVEKPPIPEWDFDFDHWTHPGLFGAVGDGVSDDTAAIQRAMDSGKPIIYFQPGRYLVSGPISVPASVRRINFMFVDFFANRSMHDLKDRGIFVVTGESEDPLLMEDLFTFERNFGHHYMIEHASRRTLVVRDVHCQSCALYINSVSGGTVFIQSAVSTTGIFNHTYQQPCFVFRGQTAWCHQLDPEYTPDKIINDGSQLFIMGFKTEGEGIAFTTVNGGRTEILGGILCFGANDNTPVALNDRSEVALIASTAGTTSNHLFKIAVREVSEAGVREADHSMFPVRYARQYTIPLYVGRLRASDT